MTSCPQCRCRLKFPAQQFGKAIRCSKCDTVFAAGISQPRLPEVPLVGEEVAAPSKRFPPHSLPPLPSPLELPAPSNDPESSPESNAEEALTKARPSRLGKPAPAPKNKQARAILILLSLVGVIGICALCGTGFTFWDRRNNLNAPPAPVAKQPGRIFNRPIAEAPPIKLDEAKPEIEEFFQSVGKWVTAQDRAALETCFDSSRIVTQMIEQKQLPAGIVLNAPALQFNLNKGLANGLTSNPQNWKKFEVRQVKIINEQEFMVFTRHRPPESGTARLRWWVTKIGVHWKIMDMEDLDLGIRVSTLVGAMSQSGVRDQNNRILNDCMAVNQAVQAMTQRQDFNEADRFLKGVDVAAFPRDLAAACHVFRAVIRIRQNRAEEALTACDEAVRFRKDIPCIEFLRAISCNQLKRWESSLKHARDYHDLVGDDPDVCYILGVGLHQTRHFREAAAYYRKTLDEEPNHMDAFMGLLHCIGGTEGTDNGDIGKRFLKLARPQDHFEECARDCWMANDYSTVELLALAMRKVQPGHADAAYYLALACTSQLRINDGVKSFRSAIQRQELAHRRQEYYQQFAFALVSRDKALQVYPDLPDPSAAFHALAKEMTRHYKLDDLQELIGLHTKKLPDDPYLQLHQGELLAREEKYVLADEAFTKAKATIADASALQEVLSNRVLARFHTGNILGAYRDFEPRRQVFQQLANLCWINHKTEALQGLVEMHSKDDPIDPNLHQAQWRLKIHQRLFTETGAILKKALASQPDKQQEIQVRQNFLYDMIDAGQAVEAYRQSPDPKQTFSLVMQDLSSSQRWKDLKEVMEIHRNAAPKDPFLSIAAAQVAVGAKDWKRAAQAFKSGWQTLSETDRQSWSYSYLYSHYKAGQAIQAYQETGRRTDYFRQIAAILLQDKNIDVFEQLVNDHRSKRLADPEFDAYDARLKALRGRTPEAAELLRRCWEKLPESDRQRVHGDFLNALAKFGKAIDAYRCSPDKIVAFQQLVWQSRQSKEPKDFEAFITLHASNHPGDPRLLIERAELLLMRGENVKAEQAFLLAKEKSLANEANMARFGLIRARIRLGKIVSTYTELGPGSATFLELANDCVVEKNPQQLESLLLAHRQAFPTFKYDTFWQTDILWLKKDYQGLVKHLRDHEDLFAKNSNRWKLQSYLVRSLVRLQKPKEALQEAEAIERKTGPSTLVVLALAATGDVPRTTRFLEKATTQFLLADSYRDEDLGPLLRSAAFASFRERFPEPASDDHFSGFDFLD